MRSGVIRETNPLGIGSARLRDDAIGIGRAVPGDIGTAALGLDPL